MKAYDFIISSQLFSLYVMVLVKGEIIFLISAHVLYDRLHTWSHALVEHTPVYVAAAESFFVPASLIKFAKNMDKLLKWSLHVKYTF